jgi:hypothetical protein
MGPKVLIPFGLWISSTDATRRTAVPGLETSSPGLSASHTATGNYKPRENLVNPSGRGARTRGEDAVQLSSLGSASRPLYPNLSNSADTFAP